MKQHKRVLTAITCEPWVITEDWLSQILDFAHGLGDPEAALTKRLEYGENGDVRRVGSTAIIPVIGPIVPHGGMWTNACGNASVQYLSTMLGDAMADEAVESIVFNFDSPGGHVTGIHELANQIRQASQSKPIVANVFGTAASGAYWLASAANEIVANPTSVVGSIGVVYAWTDKKKSREAQGLHDYEIVSVQSPRKRLDPQTVEGRQEIQERANKLAAIFMGAVASFRSVSVEEVEEGFGQGAVVLAEEAFQAGMIDRIGGIDDVLASFAEDHTALIQVKGITMKQQDKSAQATQSEPAPAVASSSMTRERLQAEHPDIHAAILQYGVLQERARLKEIKAMGIVGHSALVNKAMFDDPISAQELAVAVITADNQARSQAGANTAADAAEALAAVDPVETTTSGTNAQADDELLNIMAGLA